MAAMDFLKVSDLSGLLLRFLKERGETDIMVNRAALEAATRTLDAVVSAEAMQLAIISAMTKK
jgi:hypothetical protein